MSNWMEHNTEEKLVYPGNYKPLNKHFEIDDLGNLRPRRAADDAERERRKAASKALDGVEEIEVGPGECAVREEVGEFGDVLVEGRVVPREERLAALCARHHAATVQPGDEIMVECLDRQGWGAMSLREAARRMNDMDRGRLLWAIDARPPAFVHKLRFVRAGHPWLGAATPSEAASAARVTPVVRVDPATGLDVGEPYPSIRDAASAVARGYTAVSGAISTGGVCAGFRWRYVDQPVADAARPSRFRGGGRRATPIVLLRGGLIPQRWFAGPRQLCEALVPNFARLSVRRQKNLVSSAGNAAKYQHQFCGHSLRQARRGEERLAAGPGRKAG